MFKRDEKCFWDIPMGKEHFPRIWLIAGDKNYLLQWELLNRVTASEDFLEMSFDCEYGHVHISSAYSLQQLFEEIQDEHIRLIDGRLTKITITPPGDFPDNPSKGY
jgi:hypothetical protein